MLRKSILITSLLTLTACASERDICQSRAFAEIRPLDSLIATTQGNINRGFGLFESEGTRVVRRTCTGQNEDGTTFRFRCDETETFTETQPVALNIAEERLKLSQLQQRRSALFPRAQAAAQQCMSLPDS